MVKSSFAKFMKEEEMTALIQAMGRERRPSFLFAADKNKSCLGMFLEISDLSWRARWNCWIKTSINLSGSQNFPLLEWVKQNRYTAMHHPFTMPMEEDLQYIDTDPGRVRAKAYDIVLNGNEIGGGSVRIFNQEIAKCSRCWALRPKIKEQFRFLLNAFKYGVPPHAGLAYGLDRLVMLMAKEDSIRDVIAFPKVKDASDLMTEAPTPVDQKQLDELGLQIVREEKEKKSRNRSLFLAGAE